LFGWTDDADPYLIQDVDKAIVAHSHHVLIEYQLPVATAVDVVIVNDFHTNPSKHHHASNAKSDA
jgi:hypothetical protein